MTEIDRTKEWTFEGMRLGYRQHVSPWGHGICWATVNLDTGEVVAIESGYSADDESFSVAASCTPHSLVVPEGTMKTSEMVRLADIDPGSYSRPCVHGNRLASCGMCVIDPEPRDEFRRREAVLTGTDPGPRPVGGLQDLLEAEQAALEELSKSSGPEDVGIAKHISKDPGDGGSGIRRATHEAAGLIEPGAEMLEPTPSYGGGLSGTRILSDMNSAEQISKAQRGITKPEPTPIYGGGGCTVECEGGGGDSQIFTASGPWTPAYDAEGGRGGHIEKITHMCCPYCESETLERHWQQGLMTQSSYTDYCASCKKCIGGGGGSFAGIGAAGPSTPNGGICYPGDDGSEPEHIRGHKAADYAERVRREADAARDEIARLLYGDGKPKRNRWAFFTEPRISLAGAMIYVTLGILLGSILAANAKSADGCPKGTQFYCWTDPVTLVMHCSCS